MLSLDISQPCTTLQQTSHNVIGLISNVMLGQLKRMTSDPQLSIMITHLLDATFQHY